jgi:hypothetical protein
MRATLGFIPDSTAIALDVHSKAHYQSIADLWASLGYSHLILNNIDENLKLELKDK